MLTKSRSIIFSIILILALSAPSWSASKDELLDEAYELIDQCDSLMEQGRYKEAVPTAKKTVELAEKAVGQENLFYAIALDNLVEFTNTWVNIPMPYKYMKSL